LPLQQHIQCYSCFCKIKPTTSEIWPLFLLIIRDVHILFYSSWKTSHHLYWKTSHFSLLLSLLFFFYFLCFFSPLYSLKTFPNDLKNSLSVGGNTEYYTFLLSFNFSNIHNYYLILLHHSESLCYPSFNCISKKTIFFGLDTVILAWKYKCVYQDFVQIRSDYNCDAIK